MAKREEAGSGLRAGFISEDEALRQRLLAEREESERLETADPDVVTPSEPPKTEPVPETEVLDEGPTVEMQGISGKIITSVIKVVKKKKSGKEKSAARPEAVQKPEDAKEAQKPAVPVSAQPVSEPAGAVAAKSAEAKPSDKVEVPKKTPPVDEKKIAAAKVVPADDGRAAVRTQTAPDTKTAVTRDDSPIRKAAPAATAPVRKPHDAGSGKEKTAAAGAGTQKTVRAEKSGVADTGPAEKTRQRPAARRDDSAPAAEKPRTASRKPAEPKLKMPQPAQPTRLADKKPIRPQRGSYLGRESELAARRRSGGPPRQAGSGTFPRPARSEGQSRGRSTGPRGQGMGFDKDREEAPRQTRSPRAPQSRQAPGPLPAEFGRRPAPRGAAQRGQRRRDHERNKEQKSRVDELSRSRSRRGKKAEAKPRQVAVLTDVKLPSSMTVKELAEMLKKTTAEVIMKLMNYGVMATLNQEIDFDTAEIISNEFGIKATQLVEVTEEDILFDDSDDKPEDLKSRAPVVVVMGHVDHGKTSILDYIRKASVAEGEAGGITQHIGAYTVDVHGNKITFLDTPGHEAFTTMRARGAQVTDIAILVVAADDGVMPQTIEAINHARAADTEIIVAINKIDRPAANIDRVRQELANHDLMSSDWGGTTTIVPVSAKTGEGMDDLLEMILLTADVLELKANPDRQAKGTVIEAKLDRARGPVATVLVQRGTLTVGDTIVVGATIGNIRTMTNDRGDLIEEAGPSVPVEITGLSEVPEGGEIFYEVENERVGRVLVEKRRALLRESQLRRSSRMSLDNLFSKMAEGEVQSLNIIVKADVQGSVEAVRQSLEKLSSDEIKVNVIHGAVGAVTESDVRLADVSDAIVIGFNVRPAANVAEMAEEAGVDVRLYRVIYNAIEDIEAAMKGMLAPEFKEFVVGQVEVRETFKVSSIGTIAGCYVREGKVSRNNEIRVVRDGIVIYEGKIASLRRFKDDVREVAAGYECGIGIDKFNDIKVGDIFELFEMRAVERS
jgi:translation initiation factor IF-2